MPGAVSAQGAVVELSRERHVRARLHEVSEQQRRSLVPRRRRVQSQLVSTIRIIIARVTPQLSSIRRRRQVLDLPLVPRSALLNVIKMLQSL